MAPTLRNALVWCLLVLVPAGWIALSAREQAEAASEAVSEQELPELGSLSVLQGRLMVLLGSQAMTAPDPLGTRPMARLAAAIVLARAGEFDRAEAQWQLAAAAKVGAPEPALVDAVHLLVTDWPMRAERGESPRAGVLDDAQWKLVQERLGWFGDLARAEFELDPVAQKRAFGGQEPLMLVMVVAALWFLGVGFVGFVVVLLVAGFAIAGRLRGGIREQPIVGTVLGETFVAWMLLFLAMHLLAGRLGDGEPGVGRIGLSLTTTFASLAALGWARWRGLSWGEVRDAVGLRFDGGAWRFLRMSATSYVCAIPCMAGGIVLGMALSGLLGDRSFQDMSHPVQEMLPGASTAMRMALFLVACVGAPVVEEIAFRGLLYGHARQRSWRWPRVLSVAFAMLFSATIFAAIHPQGVLAVPALAGVSFGFCITREWSGSVYPGMVAHGLHNGVLLALNLGLQGA